MSPCTPTPRSRRSRRGAPATPSHSPAPAEAGTVRYVQTGMYFVFEVAPGQDGKAGLYLSSPLRPRCILPSLVRGWISGGAGGPLDPARPPPPHLPTHLQLGGAGIFPLFPRVEIIWENICVLWSSKSRPWCLEGDGDLGTDPAPAKPLAGGTPACLHEVFLQRGPAFGSQPGNLWIGNAWGKGQPWPRWGTGQDQACDGAGAAPGVPPRPGDASAPLPVKIYGRSRESEQREGGRSRRRDHPGLDPAACHRPGSTMTPSIPPVASPVGTFGGGFHAESSLPAALHPLAQASPRQAGGLAFLPPLPSTPPQCPPMSPWPHRPSLPPAQLHPRPVTRTACPPVLCCLLCNTRLHLP